MSKNRVFVPGMIDAIPIRTHDPDTGKDYIRIVSCTGQTLKIIADNPDAVFEERLEEGEIAVSVGTDTLYVDVKETTRNLQRQKVAADKDYFDKMCWFKGHITYPVTVKYAGTTPKELVKKFVYDRSDVVIISRPEEWYGVTKGSIVLEQSTQCLDHRMAQSVIHDIVTAENRQALWQESMSSAFVTARKVILDENFYTRPVATLVSHLHERRQQSPDTETMTFLHWRYAIGLDKNPDTKREGTMSGPDRFFYFAAYAGLFGPHIHALPKYITGPGKIVMFDHWLPLMSAQVTEWYENGYQPKTRAAFYRQVNNSPFSLKFILSICRGLYIAGQIKDQQLFINMLREELYKQWKENNVRGMKTDEVDVKGAVQEVMLTVKRLDI